MNIKQAVLKIKKEYVNIEPELLRKPFNTNKPCAITKDIAPGAMGVELM